MIDIHAHVLPGVDDGPQTMDAALDVLRASADDGVRIVCATPHVRDDFPTTPDVMRCGVEAVRSAAEDAGLVIEVRSGGEIALDRFPDLPPAWRAAFGLGGNPRLLLLEFPYSAWPLPLQQYCESLVADGVLPVLAHPERCPDVQQTPRRLAPLVELGVVVQVTAASLDGRFGRGVARCARALVDDGLAHVVASDAHAPWVRGAGMTDALKVLGPTRGRWYVEDVPAALLASEPLPPRPPSLRRRAWWVRWAPQG